MTLKVVYKMSLDHAESWSVSVRNCHSQQLTSVWQLRY